MENQRKHMRYHILDYIRGLTLISMILYHLTWDLVNIYDIPWEWYDTRGAYFWQQTICWTFILLSGFCWSMGRHRLKRGVTVLAASALITVITILFLPEDRIVFGVLTLLGVSMLLCIPLEKGLQNIPPFAGLLIAFGCFFFLRNVPRGGIGFEGLRFFQIPGNLYKNTFMAFLGFPPDQFYSSDYFPLLPWFFLFLTGYFLFQVCRRRNLLTHYQGKAPRNAAEKCISRMGQHSLLIYLLHQPVVYGILLILFSVK